MSSKGHQLRPHIVWFGEQVPLLEPEATLVSKADHTIIIDTSMQVYPSASLIDYAFAKANLHFIDTNPIVAPRKKLQIYTENATTDFPKLVQYLLDL